MLGTSRKTLRRLFEIEITAIAQVLIEESDWHVGGIARTEEGVGGKVCYQRAGGTRKHVYGLIGQ